MLQDHRQHLEKIHELIHTYGGEQQEDLQALFNWLVRNQRPSLIDRFSLFAEQARLPGWENDIQAFRQFNRIRNGLIHRGDPNVRIHVTISENEVRALEDLTERYVNYFRILSCIKADFSIDRLPQHHRTY